MAEGQGRRSVGAPDPGGAARGHARPGALVATGRVAARLGLPGPRLVAADAGVLLCEPGRLPGAVRLDRHADQPDPLSRDSTGPGAFARLLGRPGAGPGTTAALHGGRHNRWAACALWCPRSMGPGREVGTCCRIGERSAHTWSARHAPLGYPRVRNDDGSWTGWGNAVGLPIER